MCNMVYSKKINDWSTLLITDTSFIFSSFVFLFLKIKLRSVGKKTPNLFTLAMVVESMPFIFLGSLMTIVLYSPDALEYENNKQIIFKGIVMFCSGILGICPVFALEVKDAI
ncbi:MAG: hypothetical protein ACR2IQ_01725 [Minisyncoccia bacterium]